jgi:hypothetical protein
MANSAIEMSQKIRVKVDPDYKDIYNALKDNAVGEFHELFFICVCLGHKIEKREPLKKREDCFWSSTIIPDEWYAYYSIYVYDHGMDLSCLGSDEEILNVMQEYANSGMTYLIDEFLCDYTKKEASGNYLVDHLEQLPKELLFKITKDWSV